jgi:hypothetical protein
MEPAVSVAVARTGFGEEKEEPAVDYLLTVEYKPFDRQVYDTFSAEETRRYSEAADFFDELRKMLAESQKKLREEHGTSSATRSEVRSLLPHLSSWPRTATTACVLRSSKAIQFTLLVKSYAVYPYY